MNKALRTEAADPTTPPARLNELAKQSCAREVAGNPNTPPDVLRKLAGRYFEAVLANPVLPLLLVENPGFLLQLPTRTLRRLLRRPDLPGYFLDTLARHRDTEVRDAARLHRQRAVADIDGRAEVYRALTARRLAAGDVRNLLRLGLAPAWVLEPLAGSTNAALRAAACAGFAASPDPDAAAWHRLYRRVDGGEPEAGPLSAEDFARLAEGGPWARRCAARHPDTPPPVLVRLTRDEDAAARRAALRHPALPVEEMWAAAGRTAVHDRVALAENPELPVNLLERLVADPAPVVRTRALDHWAIEPAWLDRLTSDPSPMVLKAVAAHRAVSPQALARLAQSKDEWVRQAVARRGQTPPDVVERLGSDPSFWVREVVAQRPDISDALLVQLLCDPHCNVYNRAPGNPSISLALRSRIHALARDPREIAEAMAASGRVAATHVAWEPPSTRRPPRPRPWRAPRPRPPKVKSVRMNVYGGARGLPPEEYVWLARYPERGVRDQLPYNPDTPPAVLESLVEDREDHVRGQLAARAALSEAGFRRLAGDRSEGVRSYLGYNKHAPVEVLGALAGDAALRVRRSVAANARLPREAMARLFAEENPEIDAVLSRNPALPVDLFVGIASRTPSCHGTLAALAHAPVEWIETWQRDSRSEVRAGLAANPNLDPATLAGFARDTHPEVRRAAAAAPTLSPEVAWILARDSTPELALKLAQNPRTPPEVLRELATNANPKVRAAVGRHAATPREVQHALLRDHEPEVREMLLFRADAEPATIHEVLAQTHANRGFWQDLLAARGMTDELAREIIHRATPQDRLRMCHSHHPSAARQMLLLELADAKCHLALAGAAGLAAAAFEPLIETGNEAVWEQLSRHPHLPAPLLSRLADLADEETNLHGLIVCQVLRHHKATAEFRRQFAEKELRRASLAIGYEESAASFVREKVLAALLEFPEVPIDDYEPLVEMAGPDLQRALLNRPDLPAPWLERLRGQVVAWNARATSLLARLCALSAPDCPPALLAAAVRNGRWLERYAVAQNPACPTELLRALSEDTNTVVQQAANDRIDHPR